MTCAELDILLCDYVDGTLSGEDKSAVEAHLAECPTCAGLARDSRGVVDFISRAANVEPPLELVTRLLNEVPARAKAAEPVRGKVKGWLAGWMRPVMQPRLVMGMAMTILSFAMLGRFAGIEARQLRASDLDPAKVWLATEDRAHRAWQRVVKYYESMRMVYEIQTRVRELVAEDESQGGGTSEGPSSSGQPPRERAPMEQTPGR